MFVKWGNVTSSVFTVSNGVRQGGVLSPYLFNVYMDGLSTTLNTCQTGCYSGVSKVNHLMYADDLVLLSPCNFTKIAAILNFHVNMPPSWILCVFGPFLTKLFSPFGCITAQSMLYILMPHTLRK